MGFASDHLVIVLRTPAVDISQKAQGDTPSWPSAILQYKDIVLNNKTNLKSETFPLPHLYSKKSLIHMCSSISQWPGAYVFCVLNRSVQCVSEILYIHTKVMIDDDRRAIIQMASISTIFPFDMGTCVVPLPVNMGNLQPHLWVWVLVGTLCLMPI